MKHELIASGEFVIGLLLFVKTNQYKHLLEVENSPFLKKYSIAKPKA